LLTHFIIYNNRAYKLDYLCQVSVRNFASNIHAVSEWVSCWSSSAELNDALKLIYRTICRRSRLTTLSWTCMLLTDILTFPTVAEVV